MGRALAQRHRDDCAFVTSGYPLSLPDQISPCPHDSQGVSVNSLPIPSCLHLGKDGEPDPLSVVSREVERHS